MTYPTDPRVDAYLDALPECQAGLAAQTQGKGARRPRLGGPRAGERALSRDWRLSPSAEAAGTPRWYCRRHDEGSNDTDG